MEAISIIDYNQLLIFSFQNIHLWHPAFDIIALDGACLFNVLLFGMFLFHIILMQSVDKGRLSYT